MVEKFWLAASLTYKPYLAVGLGFCRLLVHNVIF